MGDYVWPKYDADNVTSSDINVEVFTPDGQHVITTFDLSPPLTRPACLTTASSR